MEFNPAEPIYLQIAEEFRRQILSGRRAPGSRVESVRDLAQDLGVNPNTIQRALTELERERLICTERTAGRTVTSDSFRITLARERMLGNMVRHLIDCLRGVGLSDGDILRRIQDYLERGARRADA